MLSETPIDRSVQPNLYGRWDQVYGDGYIRFDDTHEFRSQLFGGQTVEGTYRVLEGSAIEITVTLSRTDQRKRQIQVAKDVREIKYSLKDDTLRLKIGKRWVTFKKAS